MLTNVHVKNLALIEESEISLGKGFNVLTGETGAGKSIIIGSINYCLGAKADKEVIREGAEYALVELTFETDDEALKAVIRELDIPMEDDGVLILTRRIMPTRSVFKINGETVTAKQMKELATYLIDIHGQHEHQSLLSGKRQRELLDEFAGEELAVCLEKAGELHKAYGQVVDEIESFSMDEGKREREISLAQYEVDEIEAAALVPGEEEELRQKHSKLQNAKRITDNLSRAMDYLDGNGSVIDNLGYAVKEINTASAYDDDLAGICDHISSAEQVVNDVYREIKTYIEEFSFEGEEFDYIEQRIDVINKLSLKYGDSIEKILQYAEDRRVELEKLQDSENYLNKLKNKRDKLEAEYLSVCKKLHELRCIEAASLTKDITESLEELNFLKVAFSIEVVATENHTSQGYDEISFNISLNPGEKMRPVSDVASGGELSRIMLALKTVLAKRDNIETLIFDEIDAGISGITAWQVSKKMGQLSSSHQLICITHLPQIAAMADGHFKIEKTEKRGKTVTNIYALDDDEKVAEVARLLGSQNLSDAAFNNARELIKEAEEEKVKNKKK